MRIRPLLRDEEPVCSRACGSLTEEGVCRITLADVVPGATPCWPWYRDEIPALRDKRRAAACGEKGVVFPTEERPASTDAEREIERLVDLNRRLDEERMAAARTIAVVDNALGNGADEALWPPGLTRGEAVARLVRALSTIEARDRKIERLKNDTYCAYCGQKFPLDDEAATAVSEHIHKCTKHPMREVERERDHHRSECARLGAELDGFRAECRQLRTRAEQVERRVAELEAANESLTCENQCAHDEADDILAAIPYPDDMDGDPVVVARWAGKRIEEQRAKLEAVREVVEEFGFQLAVWSMKLPPWVREAAEKLHAALSTTPTPAPRAPFAATCGL